MRLRFLAVALALALLTPIALGQGTPLDGGDRQSSAEEESPSRSSSDAAQDPGDGSGGAAEPTAFYPHVFGQGVDEPMPFNTEFPVGEANYGLGLIAYCEPTGASEPVPFANGQCEDSPTKRLITYTTPGIVQVESESQWENEGAYSLLHNERGQMKDVHLDPGTPVSATIFLAWDRHGWSVGAADPSGTFCAYPHPPDVPCAYPYWGWDPGVNPNAAVEARLYLTELGDRGENASSAPPAAEAIEEDATVVAEGQWTGTMMNGLPGGQQANRIEIDMGTPNVTTIPKDKDLVLAYRWHSEAADEEYGTGSWRIYSGEFFPPSFEMGVQNPLTVERVVPQFAHGRVAILGIMSSPWGSYDIAEETVEMEVTGPDGTAVNPTRILKSTSFSLAHGGHFKPVNKTWVWDYNEENVQPGEYEVTVTAENIQGTGQARCTATFTLEEGPEADLVPGASEAGVCGQQAVDEERLEELREGAENETGGS